jgi:hypothetical protein
MLGLLGWIAPALNLEDSVGLASAARKRIIEVIVDEAVKLADSFLSQL